MGFLKEIGPMELIIILVIVLLLFGANRLPKLAQSMGQAIREFRSGMKAETETDETPAPLKEPATTATKKTST
ncbi:MAG: twin-arginine translocase TatA/TatE family subunit [Dehalococcoidia bacterium]|nr:twin-arginine translocase TatA/TatE family subunit [Dehalococcoidia bacterium]